MTQRAEPLSAGFAPAAQAKPDSAASARAWAAVRAWPVARQYLAVLLIIFVAKQAFNVVVFPPFSGHDEVVHFAYIRTIAEEHRVPVIPELDKWQESWRNRTEPPGDFLPLDLYQYRRYVLDWCCDPKSSPAFADQPPAAMNLGGEIYPNGWLYAANHPPLYYLLMTPVYLATNGMSVETQQYVLRAAAIPFGMAAILLTYLMASVLFPADRLIRTAAPTFVAFQTQVSYESAMINNDILLVAVFSLMIYLLARGVRHGFTFRSAAVVGLVLGLGLLTKGSMIAAAPLIAFAMVLGEGIRRPRRWIGFGAVTLAVAALVSWPWYAFLYRTYGNLSGLEQVKALQYSWTYRFSGPPSFLDLFWNKDFAQMRWKETWGEFGWRLIHLDTWLLMVIGLPLLILTVAGLVALIRSTWQRSVSAAEARLSREQVIGLWLMVLVAILCYAAMVQFGTDFSLTQARYYFQAVGAVGVVLAFGLSALTPRSWRPYASSAFLAFMITLNLLIYTAYVIPYWYLAS